MGLPLEQKQTMVTAACTTTEIVPASANMQQNLETFLMGTIPSSLQTSSGLQALWTLDV